MFADKARIGSRKTMTMTRTARAIDFVQKELLDNEIRKEHPKKSMYGIFARIEVNVGIPKRSMGLP